MVRVLREHYGVPGATAGKCAVSPVAQNITLLPWGWRERNAWKINARIKANSRGFLATLSYHYHATVHHSPITPMMGMALSPCFNKEMHIY